jgi:hypothetical protein
METPARPTRGLTQRNVNVTALTSTAAGAWKVPSATAAPGSASFSCSAAAVTHTNKEAQLRSDAVALWASPPQDEGEITRLARLSFTDDNLAAQRNTEDALSGAPLLPQQVRVSRATRGVTACARWRPVCWATANSASGLFEQAPPCALVSTALSTPLQTQTKVCCRWARQDARCVTRGGRPGAVHLCRGLSGGQFGSG